MRQRGTAAAHGGKRLAHHPLHERVVAVCLQGPAHVGWGVIHQQVEIAKKIHRAGDRLFTTPGGKQIGRDGPGPDTVIGNGVAGGIQRDLIASADRRKRALPGKGQRNIETDAAIAARHQDSLVFQTKIHLGNSFIQFGSSTLGSKDDE